ncbi:MAG: hypothetical protein V1495_01615 [Pseudomonadota bacterium]
MANKIGVLLILALFGACGLMTGNPENQGSAAAPDNTAFLDPSSDYLKAQAAKTADTTDCGYFTGQSTSTELATGRQCIQDAFAACTSAFYLFDDTTTNNKRFAAFLAVEKPANSSSCSVTVHAVSTDSSRFVGDQTKSCSALSDPIEVSCGIGS